MAPNTGCTAREYENGAGKVVAPVMSVEEARALPVLLTTDEAAAVLHVSPRHVVKLCTAGTIKAVRLGRLWRVNRDALIEYAGL